MPTVKISGVCNVVDSGGNKYQGKVHASALHNGYSIQVPQCFSSNISLVLTRFYLRDTAPIRVPG